MLNKQWQKADADGNKCAASKTFNSNHRLLTNYLFQHLLMWIGIYDQESLPWRVENYVFCQFANLRVLQLRTSHCSSHSDNAFQPANNGSVLWAVSHRPLSRTCRPKAETYRLTGFDQIWEGNRSSISREIFISKFVLQTCSKEKHENNLGVFPREKFPKNCFS